MVKGGVGRRILGCAALFLLLAAAVVTAAAYSGVHPLAWPARSSVRVGILHSLTGTMAISERPVVDATMLAIEELNARGGVLGRRIEPVVADGRSDAEVFAREAARLIDDEGVSAIFGCWTSASRRTVRPIIEERRHLLFYPVQYEGVEQSPGIVHTGAVPNQQIIPAVRWSFEHLGTRFFLVGSDYVFPRTASAIIRDQVRAQGGEILGEEFMPLGSERAQAVVDAIVRTQPDVILNTINGDSNLAFFRALRAAGVTPERIPTVSFSLGENELRALGGELVAGDYAAWSYVQSVRSPQNAEFVRRIRARFGAERVTSDPMEAAYSGVHLWERAVATAGTVDPAIVRSFVADQSFEGPGGLVYVDADTLHVWKVARVARIRRDGQFEIVWTSERAVRPLPYPPSRPQAAWERLVLAFQEDWHGRWSAPEE